MSSIHTSSETSTSTSTPGKNVGTMLSRMGKVSVNGKTVSGKRGGEAGHERSVIPEKNRQAIQSLLLSHQIAKPNQSVRSLLSGSVGNAVAVLVNFKPDPGS